MEHIKLAIIEDNAIIRESLESFLGNHPSIEVKFVADSIEVFMNTLRVTRNPQIDLILLDIGLPGISGIEGIHPLKRHLPNVDIVMLTTFEEEETIFKALCAGAVSYLSKRTPLPKIQEAIFTIYRGGSYMSPSIARKVVNYFKPKSKPKVKLTARQQQIAKSIIDGLSYKMIADQYSISIDTVRDHIKKIYKALDINSKSELMKRAMDGDL